MATGSESNTATGDAAVDGLLQGVKWNSTSIQFNFPLDASYFQDPYGSTNQPSGFVPVSSSFQTMVRFATQQYEAVSNLTFEEVGANDTSNISVSRATPDALLRPNGNGSYNGFGLAPGADQRSGDVWFNTEIVGDSLVIGSGIYRLVLHEVGHALGLKHPHETGGIAGDPTPTAFDTNDFSLMSLRRFPGGPEANTAGRLDNPQSLMQLDIAAVQHMYGANFDHNAGDNTYTFSTTTGEMSVDGLSTGMLSRNRIYRTVWDGDGEDTYDLSNYATDLDVDLRPGAASTFDVRQLARVDVLDLNTVKFASGNVFNARLFEGDTRSLIENAIGGSGDDVFRGNQVDNAFDGGDGRDAVVYLGSSTGYTITANSNGSITIADTNMADGDDGTDTLTNIEVARFDGDDQTINLATLAPVDPAPIARDDLAFASEDAANPAVNVLANDDAIDSDALTVTSIDTTNTTGIATLNPDGTVSYDPNGQFESLNEGETAIDTFRYTVSDGNGGTDTALARVVVVGATDSGDGGAAPVATDLDLTYVDSDSGLTESFFFDTVTNTTVFVSDIVSELATDADTDLDADDITFTSATVNGQTVSLADIGFIYTPGTGDAGTLIFSSAGAAAFAGLDENDDPALVTVSYSVSDGTSTDVGQVVYAVEFAELDPDDFDFDVTSDSGDIVISFFGDNQQDRDVVAESVAGAGEIKSALSISGDLELEEIFDETFLEEVEGDDDDDGDIFGVIELSTDDIAAIDGATVAISQAANGSTATATAQDGAIAVAAALTDSTGTASARDGSVAQSVATDNSTSTATSEDESTATAAAESGSTSTAIADLASSSTARSAIGSAALAESESDSFATAIATDQSTASAAATIGSETVSFAQVGSTAGATSTNGSLASTSSVDASNSTATAADNSTAVASSSDASSSATAFAGNNSVASSDADGGSISNAVATTGSASAATASDNSDAQSLAIEASAAEATANNSGSSSATAENASNASATTNDESTATAHAGFTSSSTAYANDSSVANAEAQNGSISNSVAITGATSSGITSDGSDALAFAQNQSAAESTANNQSSATTVADDNSIATATALNQSTAAALGVSSADVIVRAEDESVAGAFGLNDATASANANFADAPAASNESPTATGAGISSARAIAAAGGSGTVVAGSDLADKIADITEDLTVAKAAAADAAQNAVTAVNDGNTPAGLTPLAEQFLADASNATGSGASQATAIANNIATAESSAVAGSTSTAISEDGSLATAATDDTSTGAADAKQNSSATALASNNSNATAIGSSGSFATSMVLDGSDGNSVAADSSSSFAVATDGSTSTASATNGSAATGDASADSTASADANDNSTAVSTAGSGSQSSSSASINSIASSTTTTNSNATTSATGSSNASASANNGATTAASSQDFSGDEDTAIVIAVTVDVAPNAQTISFSGLPAGSSMSAGTPNADGTVFTVSGPLPAGLTLTPPQNFTGTFELTVESTTPDGTATATQTVTIVPSDNAAPLAVNDTAQLGEDTAVTVDVLANDSDPDGDDAALSIVGVTQGANGSASIAGGGVTYTPNADFNGSDSFTYTIADADGAQATATVDVTVAPVNDAPVAAADGATTDVATPVTIDVLANDSDIDGDDLSIDAFTQPGNGSVTSGSTPGALVYTPDAGFSGTDTFTYDVSDGNGGLDTATVTITVDADPAPPQVSISDGTITEGDDGTSLMRFVISKSKPSAGGSTVAFETTDGTATAGEDYVAQSGFVSFGDTDTEAFVDIVINGDLDIETDETFTVTISQAVNAVGPLDIIDDTGTGTIVNDDADPTNTPPVANDDAATTSEDAAVTTVNVLDNDTDADGDSLAIASISTDGTIGLVTDNGDGTFDYDPNGRFEALNDGETATDSFAYTITDGNGGTSTATVNVTINGVTDDPGDGLTDAQEFELIKLYIGYFNRAPELDGLEFHKKVMLANMSGDHPMSFEAALLERADHFFEAALDGSSFTGYSANDTTQQFVETIYDNVLLRPGVGGELTQSEIDFWVHKIDAGKVSRGELVLEFFDAQPFLLENGTPEEMAITAKAIKIIENRVTVAREFAKAEHSEGLFLAEAYEAGAAALEGVDETQTSVDAALDRLEESNPASAPEMMAPPTAMVESEPGGDDPVEPDAAVIVVADIVPEANDMMIV